MFRLLGIAKFEVTNAAVEYLVLETLTMLL